MNREIPKISSGSFCTHWKIVVSSVPNCGLTKLFKNLWFIPLLVRFFVNQAGYPSKHSNNLVGFRRPNIGRESLFWLSSLKATYILYNSDSHKILDWFHIGCAFLKTCFKGGTVLSGLHLATKVAFISHIQNTSYCWLKTVSHWNKRGKHQNWF